MLSAAQPPAGPCAVSYCESPYEAASGADAVALVTEWNEFKFLNPERMRCVGFEYYSIGRKPVLPSDWVLHFASRASPRDDTGSRQRHRDAATRKS